MFPGMDPRMMRDAMRRMGIKQTEIDAEQVVIRLKDREIVITEPSVIKINMQGVVSYQISGAESERSISTEPEITDEDIATVIEQTNVSPEKAREMLRKNNGDIAKTIIDLS
ncbi:MAG: nascent polypeptide-associated complex protein [Candidatus Woesearchaeota archaeon]